MSVPTEMVIVITIVQTRLVAITVIVRRQDIDFKLTKDRVQVRKFLLYRCLSMECKILIPTLGLTLKCPYIEVQYPLLLLGYGYPKMDPIKISQ